MASVMQPEVMHSFNMSSDGLKHNLNEVRNSGNYYVSHDLGREMNRINNGLNHMRLDSDFINTSKEWGRNFNSEALNREKAESANKIAQGASYLNQYKGNFTVPNVNNLQENQVREMHQWAGENLKGIKEDLHPYASSAQGRINQFCDYIGVTDRFTGYRNNLTRGSRDPTKLGMAWLNPAEKNPYERKIHTGEKPAGEVYLPASLPNRRISDTHTSVTVESLHPAHTNVIKVPTGPKTRSIQERCGINTTFPGITEYMKRYNVKKTTDKITSYNINPTPDFSFYGRPTAVIEYTPNHTEYQMRYEWPECRKIVKKPWLRK